MCAEILRCCKAHQGQSKPMQWATISVFSLVFHRILLQWSAIVTLVRSTILQIEKYHNNSRMRLLNQCNTWLLTYAISMGENPCHNRLLHKLHMDHGAMWKHQDFQHNLYNHDSVQKYGYLRTSVQMVQKISPPQSVTRAAKVTQSIT